MKAGLHVPHQKQLTKLAAKHEATGGVEREREKKSNQAGRSIAPDAPVEQCNTAFVNEKAKLEKNSIKDKTVDPSDRHFATASVPAVDFSK